MAAILRGIDRKSIPGNPSFLIILTSSAFIATLKQARKENFSRSHELW